MAKKFSYILDFNANNNRFINSMRSTARHVDKVTNNINESRSAAGRAEQTFNKLGGIIVGAFAVDRIIDFSKELANLSGEAEGVRSAFDQIASKSDLKNLRDSVRGTVSDLELMKRAVSAQNLGIPVKELGNLFEFATKRAQDTGQEVDYLVNSIVTGIGRKSPLILDNLGISAVMLKEKLRGVSLETASVGDITRAVGEIAQDSMTRTGEIIDTNSIKIQRQTADWENFKLAVAEKPEFKKFVGDELDELSDNFEVFFSSHLSGWEKFKSLIDITGKNVEHFAAKSRKASADAEWLASWMGEFGNEQESTIKKTKENAEKTETLSDRMRTLNAQLEVAAVNARNTQDVELFIQGQKDVAKIKKEIEELNGYLAAMQPRDTTSLNTIETKEVRSVEGGGSIDTGELDNLGTFIDANTEKTARFIEQLKAAQEVATNEAFASLSDSFAMAGSNIDGAAGSFLDFASNMTTLIPQMIAQITALTATQVASDSAAVAGSQAKTAASSSAAIAKGAEQSQSVPFPFNLIALAATVTAIVSALSQASKYEFGGVVPGNSFSGDKMMIRVNSGEEVLRATDPRHINNFSGSKAAPASLGRDRVIIPTVKIRKGDIYIAYEEGRKEMSKRNGN